MNRDVDTGLVEVLRSKDVLVLVGAGVSIAASGRREASWKGLLESGIGLIRRECPHVPVRRLGVIEELLEDGTAEDFCEAAEMITQAMGGQDSARFARWLETFRTFTAVDRTSIDALLAFGVPIVTTNYDHLIENAGTNIHPLSWRDVTNIHDAWVRRAVDRVVHLHGDWEHPADVVLGVRSYQKLADEVAFQTLQRALVLFRSIVMVGVGEASSDPNVGPLLEFVATAVPGNRMRRYWLCLDAEAARISQDFEAFIPVAYGATHAELGPYLAAVVEAIRAETQPPAAPQVTPPAGQPAPAAPERATVAARPWAQVSRDGGHWRVQLAHRAPVVLPLHGLDERPEVPSVEHDLVLAPDARAVLATVDDVWHVAWLDRYDVAGPRLVPWAPLPAPGDGARVLAVADGGLDDLRCVVSDDTGTWLYRLRPGEPRRRGARLAPEPSSAAIIFGDTVWTVDAAGHLREPAARHLFAALDRVTCLDAATGGGDVVLAATGESAEGSEIVVMAALRAYTEVEALPRVAGRVAVVRELDDRLRPRRFLTTHADGVMVHTRAWS